MNKPQVYYEGWENREEVEASFQIKLTDEDILIAIYALGDYEGSAFILFKKDGKLFEVNGGHCSCYGLEGQWEPEETTIEAIEMRNEDGSIIGYDKSYKEEIKEIIKYIKESK